MRKKVVAYSDLSRKVAILWTRVSSFQQERENCSLDTQREDCERFAAENGIRIKYYLGGKYESAKTEGKGFREMLALARKDKEVNVILVRTSSRFSRIGLEASVIKSQLRAQGIYVIPAKEFYNPDDKMCRMMDSIRDVFNNTENEQRKDATYSGTIAALNRGEWCLQVPFGFKRVRKEGTHHLLEITPEGELLRNAWIWRAKGEKLLDIVDKLNALGLRLKSGRPMHLKRLSKILQNPFYYGYIESELIENEEHRIKGNFPALIDEPTFRKANGSSFAGYEQVKECACVGAPDPKGILGEIPVLFVVSKSGQFDENGLLINTYQGLHQATKDMGVGTNAIFQAVKNSRKSKGFYWRYILDEDD